MTLRYWRLRFLLHKWWRHPRQRRDGWDYCGGCGAKLR